MRDLDKALADIFTIRNQIAAGTAFRGYGPETVAATGGVALFTAVAQFWWLDDPTGHPLAFFIGWGAGAPLSGGLILVAMEAGTRRPHFRLGRGGAAVWGHDLDRDAGALAPASFRAGRRHGASGGRAVSSGDRCRCLACGDAVEVRAGDAVDAAGAVASVCQPRGVRIRPLAAAHGRAWRRLVFRGRFCDAIAGKPEPRAVALDHGPAVRVRPVPDGRDPPFRLRRSRCRRLNRTTRRFPMTALIG